jgi:orotidine-5'-phosphate decarboxylase
MADRLIVALDVPIGLWLAFAAGIDSFLAELKAANARIFLDCKMNDIPETVEHGVAAAAARGVDIITVHGEAPMLAAAVRGKAGTTTKIFAISVLTSLDQAALTDMGYHLSLADLVAHRAKAAVTTGCDGLIASAQDNPNTPGIRPSGAARNDQIRTATPAEAIANGADYLVVGRPIIHAPDPAIAAQRIIEEMKNS